ncbi:hypothetical protein SADUNF_Sadunf12G0048400 [Salix dunnii]|uniref:Uncharacterized protein n=1 Tax=Salix dunnii TaxID=1413687 RepID=A0A835JN23_9ROSI|nr:hypothetical protein SADUNF_Sadunf12G0048400 [Salix dunnii]
MRPFQKSGFGARISSRISTIIRDQPGSIPWRQHNPSIPVAENSSGWAETGKEVNLIEHKKLEKAVKRAEDPTLASCSTSESTSDRTWSSSARVCLTGARGQRGTPSHLNAAEVGKQHRNPTTPQPL